MGILKKSHMGWQIAVRKNDDFVFLKSGANFVVTTPTSFTNCLFGLLVVLFWLHCVANQLPLRKPFLMSSVAFYACVHICIYANKSAF